MCAAATSLSHPADSTQSDEDFVEDDLEANLQRDKYARLTSTISQLIDELTPSAPDFQLRDACDQLVCVRRSLGVFVADDTTYVRFMASTISWGSCPTRLRCRATWSRRMGCLRFWRSSREGRRARC